MPKTFMIKMRFKILLKGRMYKLPDKNTNAAIGNALGMNEELCKYWNDKRLINVYQKVLKRRFTQEVTQNLHLCNLVSTRW